MTSLTYAVLYAPVTDAPIQAGDPIVVSGKRMSAASALSRYDRPTLESQGYRFPAPADTAREGSALVTAHAEQLLVAAARGYAWPEAAAWLALEQQARAYLADPATGVGPDLAADCGDCSDPAAVESRSQVIVAKADAFRSLRGEIVRWRRDGLEQLGPLAQTATVEAIQAAVETLIAAAPRVSA